MGTQTHDTSAGGILAQMFVDYGEALFRDGNKMLSYFYDLAPDCQKEKRLLSLLVQSGMDSTLLAARFADGAEQQRLLTLAEKKLENDYFVTEDAAQYIVSQYTKAIGYNTIAPGKNSVAYSGGHSNRTSSSSGATVKSVQYQQSNQKRPHILLWLLLVAAAIFLVVLITNSVKRNRAEQALLAAQNYNVTESVDESVPEDPGIVALKDMTPCDTINGGLYLDYEEGSTNTITDNMHNTYDWAFSSSDGGGNFYELNKMYATFEGRFISHLTFDPNDAPSTIRVYGDGVLLYGKTVTSGTKPVDFKVDVSNVAILEISISATVRGIENSCLVNAYLCKAGYTVNHASVSPTVYPAGTTPLSALDFFASSYYVGLYNDFQEAHDNRGNNYYEYFRGRNENDDYLEFDLHMQYSSLHGRFASNAAYPDGYMEIYGDDELLYSVSMNTDEDPVDFEIDVSGVSTLRINLWEAPIFMAGSNQSHSYLVNAYLK